MKTDNELIAEFMGFTCADTGQDRFWNPPGMPFATIYDWKYHSSHLDDFRTSWDWLMPVVEKINKIEIVDIRRETLQETIWKYVSKVQILDAHMYVVEFIKWYNSQKK